LDLVGSTLGHYKVESQLGAGGMGEIFVAEDRRLSRKVALKVLPEKLAQAPERRSRFEREARAVAALNHPNVVTIHSVEEAGGLVFLTMELVQGETLARLIPATGLPFPKLLGLALPLCEGIAAAHRAGITHRDLKPDNVMVDPQGRVKVLDFGLAKLTAPTDPGGPDATTQMQVNTEEGLVLGTVAYMSPEQAEGRPVDPRSDVFSLGILLFQMATGRRPFEGASNVSVLSAILRDTPPTVSQVRPGLPRGFNHVVARCLEKDPAARYPSAVELHQDLGALAAGRTVRGRSPSRGRWLASAVLVAAAGLGAAYWMRPGPPPPPAAAASRPAIAVLPLANLSADPDNAYFADGMTEEISTKLSKLSGLVVAARGSAARFKGQDTDVRRVGEALHVSHVLEGSVRKDGKRVKVAVRLASASTGYQLWSDEFEGELDDVFAFQEETALRIAQALDLQLSPDEQAAVRRRSTRNPQAYDEYLRGRALIEYFNDPAKLDAARAHLEKALELDHDYPLALVGLSRVEAQYHRNIDPAPARLARAEELARRALELEPKLAEAHLAMGQVLGNRYEYAGAAERFREAIRLEPDNAYAWDLLSWALAYREPPDLRGAEDAARHAISLQASLIGAHYHLGRALLLQGRYDEAIAAFEQSKRLDSTFESADFGISQVYLAQRRYAESLSAFERLKQRSAPIIRLQECAIHAGLRHTDLALAALDSALSAGYRDAAALRVNPHLTALRGHPGYAALLRKHGLTP
jgi:TolB-like protein